MLSFFSAFPPASFSRSATIASGVAVSLASSRKRRDAFSRAACGVLPSRPTSVLRVRSPCGGRLKPHESATSCAAGRLTSMPMMPSARRCSVTAFGPPIIAIR